eukprot:m.10842 g.10842  ORF g.10842 m.10842 type:complete len:333 (+) comp4363_c0_seq1:191-1189(+)
MANPDSSGTPTTAPKGRGSTIYACEECEYTATTVSDLRRHSKFHTERNTFRCQTCTASFTNKTSLAVHRRVHNRTPVNPNDPKVQFMGAAVLEELFQKRTERRERKLSGADAYRCEDCDYVSTSKQSFVHHRYRHTGEKPYKCTVNGCFAKFERPNLLAKHKKAHEDEIRDGRTEQIYKCRSCAFKSNRECDLAAHKCKKVASYDPTPEAAAHEQYALIAAAIKQQETKDQDAKRQRLRVRKPAKKTKNVNTNYCTDYEKPARRRSSQVKTDTKTDQEDIEAEQLVVEEENPIEDTEGGEISGSEPSEERLEDTREEEDDADEGAFLSTIFF